MRSFVLRGLVALTLAAVMACTDGGPESLMPDRSDASYALVSVEGVNDPAIVHEEGDQIFTLLADTLTFRRDGSATRVSHVREQRVSMASFDRRYTHDGSLVYTVNGPKLLLSFAAPCPPNAGCIRPEPALITTAGLSTRMSYNGPVLQFRRLETP